MAGTYRDYITQNIPAAAPPTPGTPQSAMTHDQLIARGPGYGSQAMRVNPPATQPPPPQGGYPPMPGYLDYLMNRADKDLHGGRSTQQRDAARAVREPVLRDMEMGRNDRIVSGRAPTPRPPVPIQGRTTTADPNNPFAGLFGGRTTHPEDDLARYMPVPLTGLSPNAPAPRQYEDGSWYVPGSESDPVLKLLQDWINQQRPNGD
jgi:hypothetical protein